ncbi:MAG: type II toxin-antitoxin system VapC family toxin [Candidatus Bathyarchaeia archaeon]
MIYLIDASAFYPLLQVPAKAREIVVNGAILDLTLYELGNVMWREYRSKRIKNYAKVMEYLTKLASLIRMIRINASEMLEIENLAIRIELTFYDAAYVYYAKKEGIKLLTNDEKILTKVKDAAIPVKEIALK